MARKITDACISCGSCEATCPISAISMGAEHYEVDSSACIDCGACEAGCPMSAIVEE